MVSLATSSTVLLLAALAAHQAQAFNVQLVNKCTYTINMFDASTVQDIAPGASLTRTIAPNSGAHVFRHTRNAQATCEFLDSLEHYACAACMEVLTDVLVLSVDC